MDPLPAFQSISDLKKSQVHYNHYNVFHILERKRLLHTKAVEVAEANGQDKSDVLPDAENLQSTEEVDKSTMAYKLYHNLTLPPLPPRYQELGLPPHWFINLVINQKKRRVHRKSHGLIPFKELAQLVATNHKSCDYETRSWCQDVATKLLEHNKSMQDEFISKVQKDKKKEPEAKPDVAREVSQETGRPFLGNHADANQASSLPRGDRRYSDQDVDEQQMLYAYKMALSRERLKQMDLANMMLAERERNMAASDRMHGFNMHNSPHPLSHPMSVPLSNASFASSWMGMQSPHSSMPFDRRGVKMVNQALPLPFAAGGTAVWSRDGDDAGVRAMDSKKPAAKSDDEMKPKSSESTKMPSPNFIELLYDMVNEPKTNDIIHWLPCGTIFNISDKKAFTKQLIPMFQGDITGESNNEKFKSFKTCLKQLGFERVTLDAYDGAYKKGGFFKMQAMAAAGRSSRDSAASLRQLEMLATANANRQAELMSQYQEPHSMYPRRSSLQDMIPGQSNMGQQRRMSNDMMIGYYQGLAAAGASLPYEMMNNRRLSLPPSSDEANSYTNEFGLSYNQVMDTWKHLEKKEKEAKK